MHNSARSSEESNPRSGFLRSAYRGILAAGAVCWLAGSIYVLTPPATPGGRDGVKVPLEADPGTLDFGTVWNSDSFHWVMPIQNVAKERVAINRVEGSCICTSITPKAFELNPGERVQLDLTLNLASRVRESGGRPTVEFGQAIAAYTADGLGPVAAWHIKGTVKNAFFTKSEELNFGDSLVHGESYSPKLLEVTCYQRCRNLLALIDEQYGTAIAKCPSGDGSHFLVYVAPNEKLDVGLHKFSLGLSAVLDSGEQTPKVSVPIEARVLQDLIVLPPLAQFGAMKLGEIREETVTVASRSGVPVEIASLECASKDVTLRPIESNGASGQAFRVQIRSSKRGSRAAEINVKVRYKGEKLRGSRRPAERIELPVRYYGMP
jgi:Protein of unknown function (DUF1573)